MKNVSDDDPAPHRQPQGVDEEVRVVVQTWCGTRARPSPSPSGMVSRLNPQGHEGHRRRPQRPRGHPQAGPAVREGAGGPEAAEALSHGELLRDPRRPQGGRHGGDPQGLRAAGAREAPRPLPRPRGEGGARSESFQEITAAFNTLTNESGRREYDQSLEKPRPPSRRRSRATPSSAACRSSRQKHDFEAVRAVPRRRGPHAPGGPSYHAALGARAGQEPALGPGGHPVPREGGAARAPRGRLPRRAGGAAGRPGAALRARKAAEAALRLAPTTARWSVDALGSGRGAAAPAAAFAGCSGASLAARRPQAGLRRAVPGPGFVVDSRPGHRMKITTRPSPTWARSARATRTASS